MPRRLRLIQDDVEWLAEIEGDHVRLDESAEAFVVRERAAGVFDVDGPDATVTGTAAASGDVVWVGIGGEAFEFHIAQAGRSARASTRDHDALMPPMSATVVRIAVKPGDRVRQGDVLIALEAMKMELAIRAPRDGVVAAVHCRECDLVEPGMELAELSPLR